MCKIHPEDESLIVLASNENKSDAFWMKCFGFLALPCCCIGLSCFGISSISKDFAEKYANIVKFYGGIEKCNLIKKKVDIEIDLFNRSVMDIRNSEPNLHIDPNVTLFDLIRQNNKQLSEITTRLMYFKYITSKEYATTLWNRYLELGGNSNLIIYGLIEYLLTFNSSTSKMMEVFIHNVCSNTPLRVEVLLAKKNVLVD